MNNWIIFLNLKKNKCFSLVVVIVFFKFINDNHNNFSKLINYYMKIKKNITSLKKY